METNKYYIVEASALPEVFRKVCEAKQYISSGKVKTVNQAAEKAGISRSAFYKYKDAVKPFYEMSSSRIITFQIMLEDKPGVLSGVLAHFAKSGANVLTINQSIPVNGQAAVTISAEIGNIKIQLDKFISKALLLSGVLHFEPLAGE